MIVLDTDLISEVLKIIPAAPVVRWLRQQETSDSYLTSISLAELRFGIERLPHGQKREMLGARVELLFERDFQGRVLAFDAAAAFEFGSLAARLGQSGLADMLLDAQIAAIARAHGAIVATRNIKHFKLLGCLYVDPWSA